MNRKLRYLIASVPDREELVAELWYGDEMWGEISQESGEVVLELYPKPDGEPWRFPPEAVERLMRAARCDLLNIGPTSENAERAS